MNNKVDAMDSSTNNKKLECELRGPMTWSDYFDLKKRIEEDYGEFVVTKELAIFIKGEHDLRIKIDNKGGRFVYKRKIGIDDYKKEIEVNIENSEILKFIEILSSLGHNASLYSYVEKYEAKKDNKSFSVKFGSKIGDFFEIETLLDDAVDIHRATSEMEEYVRKIGLNIWSNEVYNDLLKSSWKNEKEAPMFDEKTNSFNAVIVDSIGKILQKEYTAEKTIKEVLESATNDYSREEDKFFKIYGQSMLSENIINDGRISIKTSIVIPTYNSRDTLLGTLLSLNSQDLTNAERKLIEVIVVDDGSTDNTHNAIDKYKYNFELKYIRQNHIGRGNARNVGSAISRGSVIIFLDSDIIVEENFIREHVLRHQVIDKAVFLSFKENINVEYDNIARFAKKHRKPNIVNDFRFHKRVDPEWLRMHRHVRAVECREVKLLEETDNFRTFGQRKICGVWDLSSMVVTCAVSVKKSEFIDSGGFNLQFTGWGMEDTFLGTCLIARGNFVIPVFSTGVFHIEHATRSGNERQKIKEFNKNVLVYLDLIGQRANNVIKNVDGK